MKKLKLDLDKLTVESFETTAGMDGTPGTIHGQGGKDDADGGGPRAPDTTSFILPFLCPPSSPCNPCNSDYSFCLGCTSQYSVCYTVCHC